jgi:LacI family transcriptional regulator
MKKKVTAQDIADSLGLSRNTVSKALNNHPSIAEATQKLVLEKAAEMGYKKLKNLPLIGETGRKRTGHIVVVTHEQFVDASYWSIVSRGAVDTLNQAGYNLIFNYIKQTDLEAHLLPQSLAPDCADGMIVLGTLRADYVRDLLGSGLPAVYIDAALELAGSEWQRDTILMENEASTYRIARTLIEQGHSRLGFIGDIHFCRSYFERWRGFRQALEDSGLAPDPRCCIIDPQPYHYQQLEEVRARLANFNDWPTAFVCANDRTAILLIKVLKERGLNVPAEVAVSGFDDIFEATVVEPYLTTVRIHKEALGRRAAEQLLWRMRHPEHPAELVYIATEVIFRASTGERR